MSTRHYLFGFSGRINRAKIWLWVLIAIALSIVVGVIACLGFDWTATVASLKAQQGHLVLDYHKIAKPGCKGTVSLVALILIGLIALAYVWAKLAIYTKRLHDRGRSAWWLLVYVVLPIVLQGVAQEYDLTNAQNILDHQARLENRTAETGFADLLERLKCDVETFFLSPQGHHHWRGGLPYEEFPFRRVVSLQTIAFMPKR